MKRTAILIAILALAGCANLNDRISSTTSGLPDGHFDSIQWHRNISGFVGDLKMTGLYKDGINLGAELIEYNADYGPAASIYIKIEGWKHEGLE